MNRSFAHRVAFATSIVAIAVSIAACGGQPAAPAPAEIAPVAEQATAAPVVVEATQAPASEATAAPAIAMADAPQLLTPQQYEEQFAASGAAYQLIDVRTPEEYAEGHIAGSVNIAVESLSQHLGEISKDEPVVLYCRSGNRSAQAAEILDAEGYTGVYDLGGIKAWQAAGLPVEK